MIELDMIWIEVIVAESGTDPSTKPQSRKSLFLHAVRPNTSVTLMYVELVRFEVFTAVTMKNGVFWDVTPCGSCKN
jgi:hypothetical protein